jgi:hypothetical protein
MAFHGSARALVYDRRAGDPQKKLTRDGRTGMRSRPSGQFVNLQKFCAVCMRSPGVFELKEKGSEQQKTTQQRAAEAVRRF